MIHSFAVVIDGVDLTSPDSGDADALYEAGGDDALLTSSAGVQRAIFGLPCEERDTILPRLDAYAKVMRG